MQFVRPNLPSEVMTCAEVERLGDEDFAVVAGWPIARQHPKGRNGTIFVTLEDETGDTQVILWPRVYAEYRRELSSQVVLVRGRISAWDGTVNLIASEVRAIPVGGEDAEVSRLAVRSGCCLNHGLFRLSGLTPN